MPDTAQKTVHLPAHLAHSTQSFAQRHGREFSGVVTAALLLLNSVGCAEADLWFRAARLVRKGAISFGEAAEWVACQRPPRKESAA